MVTKKEHSILDYYRPFNIPMHPPEVNELFPAFSNSSRHNQIKNVVDPVFLKLKQIFLIQFGSKTTN